MVLCKVHDPLISVIVPAYNAERFISQTLESVLSQTFQNFEVLVVDDGSLDGTADTVRQYTIRDNRVILIQQKNAGVAAARNRGILSARGEFIAPIDSDDIWFPEFLEAVLPSLAEPQVGMVYAWSVFVNEEGHLQRTCQSSSWQGNDYLPLLYRNLPGNASCTLLRRECVEAVGGYDQSYRDLNAQGCEDWDLYLRLAQISEVRVVPRLLVGYRQVGGSMSMALKPMETAVDLVLDRFAQQHPEIDPAIYAWNRSDFAWYLAVKSQRSGHDREVLNYMRKALSLDYFPLLRINFYRLGTTTILKILWRSIAQQIGFNHPSWLSFKKNCTAFIQSKTSLYRRITFFPEEITLEELEKQQFAAKQRFPRYHYEKFVSWRCDRIRRKIQKLDLP